MNLTDEELTAMLAERPWLTVEGNCQEKTDSSDLGPVAGKGKRRTAKTGKDTERAFQGRVLALAKAHKWRVAHFRPAKTDKGWRTAVSANGAGFPDLILAHGACLFAAELKSEKGKVSEEQAAWLAAFQAAGIPAFVWRPSDLDEIERILDK